MENLLIDRGCLNISVCFYCLMMEMGSWTVIGIGKNSRWIIWVICYVNLKCLIWFDSSPFEFLNDLQTYLFYILRWRCYTMHRQLLFSMKCMCQLNYFYLEMKRTEKRKIASCMCTWNHNQLKVILLWSKYNNINWIFMNDTACHSIR